MKYYKYLLYNIKSQLKQEFSNSINKYWANKIESIPRNDGSNMFPQVKNIFRKKDSNSIPALKILQEKTSFLQEAGIDMAQSTIDKEENFIISEATQKLNVIGTHFAKIYTQNIHMGKERLNNIIKLETNKLKKEIKQDT